ncbi:uncharacterized protein LOC108596128 [Drosophila busckii]|uniref:uncharacterized protein LOC108596128 n=1 Tax=Drosophila busckii TaxID=30019 RepID=UPI00083EF80F|nr:uncharacterized protein LOC108596128 [Drosophila busckii]
MYNSNCKLFCLLFCTAVLFGQVLPQDSEESAEVKPSASTDGALTAETCSTERAGCCSTMFLGPTDSLLKCYAIHSSKMPASGDKDTAKTLSFLSCFVECLYKQRKYIGKNDSINMKMVKLDAAQLYKDRPKEKEYYIRMFEYCRKDAMPMYNSMKNSPGAKALLRNACRPFLMFVYLCQAEYHTKHECPYFRWEGSSKAGNKESCAADRAKCYGIDGLKVPKDL